MALSLLAEPDVEAETKVLNDCATESEVLLERDSLTSSAC